MQFRFHDATRGIIANLPQTRSMKGEIHQLVQDIAVERSPREIENRIKIIQRQVSTDKRMLKPILPWETHDMLHGSLEIMRDDVRRFPDY